MKTLGDGSHAGGASKKRHKRRAHATNDASGGSSECRGDHTCELCSSPMRMIRGTSADEKSTQDSVHLRGQGDPSLVAAFYCKIARLHGLLHQKVQSTLSAGGTDFTEDGVLLLGNQMTGVVSDALRITKRCGSDIVGAGLGCSGNPFVMLLSVLLPPLRKFLAWTWTTRSVWYGSPAPSSIYHQRRYSVTIAPAADSNTSKSNANVGDSRVIASNPVLWLMLAQHDVITSLVSLFATISKLIKQNDDMAESAPQSPSLSTSTSSPTIPSSSEALENLSTLRIPQVYHISLEFEDVFCEYRVCLAELTECLVESLGATASHLCRPVVSKDASKARGSANEFIELLVLQILDPVAKRFIESPSPSRLYLLPRLLDKCISVVIDEFILRRSARMNEISAGHIEKGAMYLRTWSLRVETDYNMRARALATASDDHGGARRLSTFTFARGSSTGVKSYFRSINEAPHRRDSGTGGGDGTKLLRTNSSQDDFRGRLDARMELSTLDSFKRLENHMKQWVGNERGDGNGPLHGRSRGGNLADGLRDTLVRTFTARNSGNSLRLDG